MASVLERLRGDVFDAIVASQSAGLYVVNEFETREAWFPFIELEQLVGCHVWVIGPAIGLETRMTRGGFSEAEQPIQVGVQARVDPNNVCQIDTLAELVEQLRETCRKLSPPSVSPCGWLRHEPMRDPNGSLISFMDLREKNLFQSVFTAFYKVILP